MDDQTQTSQPQAAAVFGPECFAAATAVRDASQADEAAGGELEYAAEAFARRIMGRVETAVTFAAAKRRLDGALGLPLEDEGDLVDRVRGSLMASIHDIYAEMQEETNRLLSDEFVSGLFRERPAGRSDATETLKLDEEGFLGTKEPGPLEAHCGGRVGSDVAEFPEGFQSADLIPVISPPRIIRLWTREGVAYEALSSSVDWTRIGLDTDVIAWADAPRPPKRWLAATPDADPPEGPDASDGDVFIRADGEALRRVNGRWLRAEALDLPESQREPMQASEIRGRLMSIDELADAWPTSTLWTMAAIVASDLGSTDALGQLKRVAAQALIDALSRGWIDADGFASIAAHMPAISRQIRADHGGDDAAWMAALEGRLVSRGRLVAAILEANIDEPSGAAAEAEG